jgi:RimJ/RimL family protein N-acetyltransferase
MFGYWVTRPLSPAQVNKAYEELEKPGEEGKNRFYFTIRLLPDERLLGFAKVYSIAWNHGTGRMQIGIGDPADRGKGYGGEALKLLLRFTFEEINLHRLTAAVPEYNSPALRLFEKAGFCVEVRQRQLLHRDGHRWDMLGLGLLRSEWMQGEDALPLFGGER